MIRQSRFRGWQLLVVAALILAVAIGLALQRNLQRKSPVERFRERIVVGSTRAEVEDALGGPPGDYKTQEYISQPFDRSLFDGWSFNGHDISVEFNEEDKVIIFLVEENLLMFPRKPWWKRIFK